MSSSVSHDVVCSAWKLDEEAETVIIEMFANDLAFLPARFSHQVEKEQWAQVSLLLLGAQLCKHASIFSIVASQSACGERHFHNHIQGGRVLPFFFFLCQTVNGSLENSADLSAHLYAIANGRDKFESTLPADVCPLSMIEILLKMCVTPTAPFTPSIAINDR